VKVQGQYTSLLMEHINAKTEAYYDIDSSPGHHCKDPPSSGSLLVNQ